MDLYNALYQQNLNAMFFNLHDQTRSSVTLSLSSTQGSPDPNGMIM